MTEDECKITVTRSAGADGAVVIFIDGDFTGQGLRVLLNDHDLWGDTPHQPADADRDAGEVTLTFRLSDIAYERDNSSAH